MTFSEVATDGTLHRKITHCTFKCLAFPTREFSLHFHLHCAFLWAAEYIQSSNFCTIPRFIYHCLLLCDNIPTQCDLGCHPSYFECSWHPITCTNFISVNFLNQSLTVLNLCCHLTVRLKVTGKFPCFGAKLCAESHIKQRRSMKSQFNSILNRSTQPWSQNSGITSVLHESHKDNLETCYPWSWCQGNSYKLPNVPIWAGQIGLS